MIVETGGYHMQTALAFFEIVPLKSWQIIGIALLLLMILPSASARPWRQY
jgi:hypothetical protein